VASRIGGRQSAAKQSIRGWVVTGRISHHIEAGIPKATARPGPSGGTRFFATMFGCFFVHSGAGSKNKKKKKKNLAFFFYFLGNPSTKGGPGGFAGEGYRCLVGRNFRTFSQNRKGFIEKQPSDAVKPVVLLVSVRGTWPRDFWGQAVGRRESVGTLHDTIAWPIMTITVFHQKTWGICERSNYLLAGGCLQADWGQTGGARRSRGGGRFSPFLGFVITLIGSWGQAGGERGQEAVGGRSQSGQGTKSTAVLTFALRLWKMLPLRPRPQKPGLGGDGVGCGLSRTYKAGGNMLLAIWKDYRIINPFFDWGAPRNWCRFFCFGGRDCSGTAQLKKIGLSGSKVGLSHCHPTFSSRAPQLVGAPGRHRRGPYLFTIILPCAMGKRQLFGRTPRWASCAAVP